MQRHKRYSSINHITKGIIVFMSVLFFLGCEEMERSVGRTKLIGEDIKKVNVVIEQHCGYRPLVGFDIYGEKINHIKLIFTQKEKIICADDQVIQLINNYFSTSPGYSKQTQLAIEYTHDKEFRIIR